MCEIAKELSKGETHIRIDLYEADEKIYFGEITMFSDSGFPETLMPRTDELWGNLMDLSLVK